ncbi:SDR family oxidoreductase [Sanguibacter antarcticus]|uniref:3-oxoacyl-[acyl-carrier protein] reductase n=1 Tax=Sanguibacter antarcticus TaxID=372484 RepID=A0A2A9E2K8_9MICO|nr:SDR family oxidoreductase [Sanguibacter antarcticus]PFG32429.1 3-oxoacyl-[acyl-carrier protein] reductase [Sanguibacter antarcticus]
MTQPPAAPDHPTPDHPTSDHPTPQPPAALPLAGRTALVTGVSRRRGIGYAVATRLAALGASVVVHHFSPHDADQPWGADDLDAVRAGIREALVGSAVMGDRSADLRDPHAAVALVDEAHALTGRLDILVCNHARSGGDGSILDMTADRLDAFWDANTRSTLLLTQRFAQLWSGAADPVDLDAGTSTGASPTPPGGRARSGVPTDERATGRVFWMTSGQGDGPMRGEVAYVTSKAALSGATATVAAELLELGIVLNTINPGPVNTGYLDPETSDRDVSDLEVLVSATPFGRFGRPDDPARLIGWLAGDEGVWVVGQVLTTDGGMRLFY